jgi:hypothetical protein
MVMDRKNSVFRDNFYAFHLSWTTKDRLFIIVDVADSIFVYSASVFQRLNSILVV